MAVSRGIGKFIVSIIGIIVLLTAVVVIASVLGTNAPIKPLIYKNIDLRNAKDPVERADLITTIDDLVVQANSEEVREQWDRMLDCLKTACPDEAFLDMSLVVISVFEEDIPESSLLINVIATAKYWDNTDNLLQFSKALSLANAQVEEIESRKAEKMWDEIVECNNTCAEKNDLYFDLIRIIVQ